MIQLQELSLREGLPAQPIPSPTGVRPLYGNPLGILTVKGASAMGPKTANGRLTLYFSYADGAGKTSAMLQALREECLRGVDGVVGMVDPKSPAKTLALLEGLEQIPPNTPRGVRPGCRPAPKASAAGAGRSCPPQPGKPAPPPVPGCGGTAQGGD